MPSLHHEIWRFGISRPKVSRATACTASARSFDTISVTRPARPSGVRYGTKGRGMNSVKPPVSAWRSRRTARCRATCRGVSMCPKSIVDVLRMPIAWAVRTISTHRSVESLAGQMSRRTSSTRISAAVPHRLP